MNGFRLLTEKGKKLNEVALAVPRDLFCATRLTFPSGHPAMGDPLSGLMFVNIQRYCWFSVSSSGALRLTKLTRLRSSSSAGAHWGAVDFLASFVSKDHQTT